MVKHLERPIGSDTGPANDALVPIRDPGIIAALDAIKPLDGLDLPLASVRLDRDTRLAVINEATYDTLLVYIKARFEAHKTVAAAAAEENEVALVKEKQKQEHLCVGRSQGANSRARV
jgi:hypothetical protein